jgi:hypothetical protein
MSYKFKYLYTFYFGIQSLLFYIGSCNTSNMDVDNWLWATLVSLFGAIFFYFAEKDSK